jgi:nitroreductase
MASEVRESLPKGRKASMEVFEAVRTVLAIRNYKATPIAPDVVYRIVEAGRLSGSAMNGQPWHFIVVEDKNALKQLGALARTGPYVAKAPLAIVVAIQKSKFAVADAARAIQSMILTAWSEGVGSNWVGFMGLDDVKPLLNIPGELDVLAVIPFGYPPQPVGKGKKNRKPLSEIAHRDRFGRPFEWPAQ